MKALRIFMVMALGILLTMGVMGCGSSDSGGTATKIFAINSSAIAFTVPTGFGELHGSAYDSSTGYLYITANTGVYVYDTSDLSQVTILTQNLSDPQGLTFDGSDLWEAEATSHKFHQIDEANGNILASRDLEEMPAGIAYEGGNFWISDEVSGSGRVYKVNSFGAVQAGPFSTGTSVVISDLVVTIPPLNSQNYLVGVDANELYFVNKTNGRIIEKHTISTNNARGVAWDGQYFWITDRYTGDVHKVSFSIN